METTTKANDVRLVKSIIRSFSHANFPSLDMSSLEDDDILLDDFDKCLSTLPPKCLFDSDSMDFEFFETYLETSQVTRSTNPMKPFCLTKKQWQSCVDLFGTKQIAKLLRRNSRSVFKKQASLRENSLEDTTVIEDGLKEGTSKSEVKVNS